METGTSALTSEEIEEDLMRYEVAQVAIERWSEIRDRIMSERGIRPVGEDYDALPKCLRRRDGIAIDVMGAMFGFSYIDEFVGMVASAYDAYTQSITVRKPRIKRHWMYPEVQNLLDGYYETYQIALAALKHYGSKHHPKAVPFFEEMRYFAREYKAACAANDLAPVKGI